MQYIDKQPKSCPFCGWKKQSVMEKTEEQYLREHNITVEEEKHFVISKK